MFEEEQVTVGLQDASSFPDGGVRVWERAQAKHDHDCVELFIGEWQRFGVGLHEANRGSCVWLAAACSLEHVRVGIHAHDLVGVRVERQAQARANREVQNPAGRVFANADALAADPAQLERERERVVHRGPNRVLRARPPPASVKPDCTQEVGRGRGRSRSLPCSRSV